MRRSSTRGRCAFGVALAILTSSMAGLGCREDAPMTPPPPPPGTGPKATANGETAAGEVQKQPAPTIEGDRLAGQAPMLPRAPRPQEPSPFRFTDVAAEAGLAFHHFSGMTADKHFPTANGSGVAVFDFDGDGLLDVYFATCTLLPLGTAEKGPNRLFRNLGEGKFADVTEKAGLGFRGFCHGILVGDIDNDGDQDVYLCNYGPNVLYENLGDGSFRDISQAAGIGAPNWSSSGAFLDFDNDGLLDLYVSHYGTWKLPDDDLFCGDRKRGLRLYCSPRSIRTTRHVLYRNNGDKTFTDVTESAGLARTDGHGFGVVAADLDGDGKVDLWVANDMNPKFLFLNNGDGTFRDETDLSGAALDANGNAQAGMGVDAEDIDGDGRPELFATHFQNEYNTLYQNLGKGRFFDQTAAYGMAADSMPYVGWGCALVDFNNDGWPDAFVGNGHVDDNRDQLYGTPPDYQQPAHLFANVGVGPPGQQSRRFRLATRDVGPYFESNHVARGAAFGDIDNDGDTDIVVNHKDGPPALLRNDTPLGEARWIRLKLVGTKSNRDGIGAKVEAHVGPRVIHRQRKGGVSLMSSHDPRVLVGLGEATEVAKLVVRWPSGRVSELEHLATNQDHEIVEPAEDAPAQP